MIKICFDSSAVGKLVDVPLDDAKNTLAMERLMRNIASSRERFDLVVAPVFMAELNDAPDGIISNTVAVLECHRFTVIDIHLNFQAAALAKLYFQQSVLPEDSYDDLRHIAYASVADCDYLISCDHHFLKPKTAILVKQINTKQNVSVPHILSPSELIKEKIW